MESEEQINRSACQNDLTAEQPYQPTRTQVHHPKQEAEAMTIELEPKIAT